MSTTTTPMQPRSDSQAASAHPGEQIRSPHARPALAHHVNHPLHESAPSGFTLLEMLVATTIIAILVALSFPLYGAIKGRFEDVTCTTHMKSLKVAFDNYLQDNRKWPQPPPGLEEDEEKMWKWWIEELEPYDVYQKQWLCPTHRGAINQRPQDEIPEFAGTYVPTQFDDHEFTPYRWRQPWLLERGDFHGRGAKFIMPDGSIDTLPDPAKGGAN